MTGWTEGPWRLVWWGNEQYPYPLSILADNDGKWIARDGTVSSEANARLIAAAPDLYEALVAANSVLTAAADELKLHQNGVLLTIRAALTKATGEGK